MPRAPSENVQLKVRMKEPLRQKLEKAAQERGVSMNVEAVSRLEQSFETEDRAAENFGGREKYQIFRTLSSASDAVETRTGNSWLTDAETATTVNELWVNMIPLFLPSLSAKEVMNLIESTTPLPLIPTQSTYPDLPERLSRPPGDRSKMSKADIAREMKEFIDAQTSYAVEVDKYKKKNEKREVAVENVNSILDRRQKLLSEWDHRVSSSISEGLSMAQELSEVRR
jgi:hypothetical protein